MRPLYIYVCHRGWVYVGRPRQSGPDALFIVLDDFAVVRQWGTTQGLGQLAREGPRPETKFDPEPNGTEIAVTDIKRRIPTIPESWRGWPKR